jgi:hypothetical protein
LGAPGALRSPNRGPTQSQGDPGSQEDRTMSNYCIKERKEYKKKIRGPRRAWKGPYVDPKGALGAPSGSLRRPHQGP